MLAVAKSARVRPAHGTHFVLDLLIPFCRRELMDRSRSHTSIGGSSPAFWRRRRRAPGSPQFSRSSFCQAFFARDGFCRFQGWKPTRRPRSMTTLRIAIDCRASPSPPPGGCAPPASRAEGRCPPPVSPPLPALPAAPAQGRSGRRCGRRRQRRSLAFPEVVGLLSSAVLDDGPGLQGPEPGLEAAENSWADVLKWQANQIR